MFINTNASAECIMLYVLTSVPSCKLGPARTRPRVSVDVYVCPDVCPSSQNASSLRVFVRLRWFFNTMVPTLGKLVILTGSGTGRCDVINDVIKFSLSNGYISATDRPIDFVFDPRVRFSGTADRLDVLPVSPNPRWRLLMTSSRNNHCRNFGAKL